MKGGRDMLPFISSSDVLAIYEDRIRDAKRPVPEWIGIDVPRKRPRSGVGVLQQIRISFAGALRGLAASLDPQQSTVKA
jgi:hypothetical protein